MPCTASMMPCVAPLIMTLFRHSAASALLCVQRIPREPLSMIAGSRSLLCLCQRHGSTGGSPEAGGCGQGGGGWGRLIWGDQPLAGSGRPQPGHPCHQCGHHQHWVCPSPPPPTTPPSCITAETDACRFPELKFGSVELNYSTGEKEGLV